MKKQTYMVLIKQKITIEAEVLVELIAESPADAVSQVKKNADEFSENNDIQYDLKQSAIEQLDNGDWASSGKTNYVSCGLASKYHSASECELCTEVAKQNKRVG